MICAVLFMSIIPTRLRSIALGLLFIVSISGFAKAAATRGSVDLCGLTDAEAAGLQGNVAADVQAIPQFKKTIAAMLADREYRQIDCLADSFRANKEIFPGGMWKVHTIYLAIEKPLLHPTEKDWKQHIDRLERWTAERPDSVTARVALAEAYIDYGWAARGEGYSDTVSETGWKVFEKSADHARKTLGQARKIATKCPEWYVAMQDVALAQSWRPEAKRALLEKAISFEPGYYYYSRIYANSLLPQWDGAEGQVEEFLDQTADNLGGSAGDILYFHVADSLLCCANAQVKLSWPRISRGFDALEKQTGVSMLNVNIMGRLATKFSDVVVANKMMSRIGDQWSDEIWGTQAYFESVKTWARQIIQMPAGKSEPEKGAEANLSTPEGQRYSAAVDQTIRSWIPECVKAFPNADANEFKFMIRISKAGFVDQLVTVGSSAVGDCLSKKAGSRAHSYSPPPRPNFWVQFQLDPATMAASGTR